MNKIDVLSTQPELVQQALASYKFQTVLTTELDNYEDKDFTDETLLKIVLWKVNRYPHFDDSLLEAINNLRKNCTEETARSVLKRLLDAPGFDLPMASTVLRFACPNDFQIIDKRVYRFIMPDKDVLKIPYNLDRKIDFYFKYLQALRENCQKYEVSFKDADRIFYQLDKALNSDIPINY